MNHFNTTGPSPLCVGPANLKGRRYAFGIDSLNLGGCLDAPEFIAVGAAQCELTGDIYSRDEVIAADEAGLPVTSYYL